MGPYGESPTVGIGEPQASATDLPFADHSFDVACSFKVLAHVPKIESMSQLIGFLIDEGVFGRQQPSQSAQVM